MIIHSVKATPVRGKDGKYHMVEEEFDEFIPDENVRHNMLCTICGFPEYPECTKVCSNGNVTDDEEDD